MIKDFIYFDTDYIQSYVAQIEKGLLTRRSIEDGNIKENESQMHGKQKTLKTSGGASVPGVLNFGRENERAKEYEDLINKVTQSGLRVAEYELHDYIYEILYSDIKCNNLLIQKSINNPIGKYIQIEADYKFVNLDSFKEILGNKKIIELIGKHADSANEIVDIIDAISILLPTSTFVSIENYIVPLKDKFLRETVKEIKFKYSGKITLIGKVVSSFGKSIKELPEKPNIFELAEAIDGASVALLSEMGIKNIRFVVMPIALYF